MPTAPGIGHDLTVAAGGYVAGRQAENLVRRTLNRLARPVQEPKPAAEGVTTAAEEAAAAEREAHPWASLGANHAADEGAAVGVAGRSIAARAAPAAVAAEGGTVVVSWVAGTMATAAATADVAAEAVGGAELAGAGLAAGELIFGGVAIVGGAVLLYEAYQHYHHTQEKPAHGQ